MLTVLRFLLKTKNLLVVLAHKLRKLNISLFSNNLLVICSPREGIYNLKLFSNACDQSVSCLGVVQCIEFSNAFKSSWLLSVHGIFVWFVSLGLGLVWGFVFFLFVCFLFCRFPVNKL